AGGVTLDIRPPKKSDRSRAEPATV
ncbi:MAG: hypothetical protein RLZ83_1606, partial [Pseudomonadota bacterium]